VLTDYTKKIWNI